MGNLSLNKKKIIVVMPAYNAAKTLADTYARIPKDIVDEVILVDDASSDKTVLIASKLNIYTIRHSSNLGYGGNQKSCYTEALKHGGDVIVMLHPDGQYEPQMIPHMIKPIINEGADLVLGSRMAIKGEALKGGMPRYKFIANKILTFIENIALGLRLSEYHTGYRAYSRRLLEIIPFMKNSNGFVFDSQIIIQARRFNLVIKEVPVKSNYFKDASSINFYKSVVYGLQTLWMILLYLLDKKKLIRCKLLQPEE